MSADTSRRHNTPQIAGAGHKQDKNAKLEPFQWFKADRIATDASAKAQSVEKQIKEALANGFR